MTELLEASSGAEMDRLMHEHRLYAQRLDELMAKPYLSVEEQMEEVRLKKLKLHTKDLMTALEHRIPAVA